MKFEILREELNTNLVLKMLYIYNVNRNRRVITVEDSF